MSWRSTQLGGGLCDQDRLIIELFKDLSVQYIGIDPEFSQQLQQSPDARHVVLIINQPIWCSEIVRQCHKHLTSCTESFYLGINRYLIKGNDTGFALNNTKNKGQDVVDFITNIVSQQGFVIEKSGHFDKDQGRYFNFVQPLTWIYGRHDTN